jgi:hypothetical protein
VKDHMMKMGGVSNGYLNFLKIAKAMNENK